VLLNDGWPLAKIADFVRLTGEDGLLGLLPNSAPAPTPPPTRAQELVRKFQHGGSGEESAQYGPAARPVNPMHQSIDHLRRRQEAFPDGALPEVETWLRIELTPWCHVYIEREAANNTPFEMVERLSRELAQALIEFIRRGNRK
jgi:hypothetical protein